MKNGHIAIHLQSGSWNAGPDSPAVAEVVRKSGSTSVAFSTQTLPIGVNGAPGIVSLAPGGYTVRIHLPSGDVFAESVFVKEDTQEQVVFEMESPREWLSADAVVGAVQALPTSGRARALEFFRSDAPRGWNPLDTGSERDPDRRRRDAGVRMEQAIADLDGASASVNRISGREHIQKIAGWLRVTNIDASRPFPEARVSTAELVRWWTGAPGPASLPLQMVEHDEHNAKLVSTNSTGFHEPIASERRKFAAIKDPIGSWHFAVFPEGWEQTWGKSIGSIARANVLMTVVVDSVMRSTDESGEAARWRCATAVSDLEAMSYLGFLYSGQSMAAGLLLEQATELLFEKSMNPVAAAAGAFGVLAFPEEAGARRNPAWRQWIKNLYSRFPSLPDGAIAMAQMYLKFGEHTGGDSEHIAVETLRQYALEAVRRGLPYLSYGVNLLLEILLLLVQDDSEHRRAGDPAEDTRRALALVQQLARLMTPGTFFTVLETAGTPV